MFGFFKKRRQEPSSDELEFDRSQIVPRVKTFQFLDALREQGIPEDQIPVTEPLVADLIVTYAFDLPQMFMMVTPDSLAELGVEPAELRGLAIENLRRSFRGIGLQETGPLYRVVTGDHLEACALLSRTFWSSNQELVKGDLVVTVPNRDVLFFCDSESEEGMELVREIAEEGYASGGTHALTLQLLKWTESGWRTFED